MMRERFNFWLDLTKDHEFQIAEVITDLKKRRLFAKTIRDGIRLICDLRAGVRTEQMVGIPSTQGHRESLKIADLER